MRFVKRVTDSLTWVGANDRRLAMFEGVYSVPRGVSYNSYLLTDGKTVLFDTVDKAVSRRFLENLAFALDGRALDYIVVQHMEPDHSAALEELTLRHPNARIVCNEKTLAFIGQFFDFDVRSRALVVKEGDTLDTGRRGLRFIMAPMVHWPEVMVTYDPVDKVLFSADAFGCFGALNGALFADEVDFGRDYMDEARRYYANIVGKYGAQVKALLGKAAELDVEMICPLHGFVWRKNLNDILAKYMLWSRYEPEERGVLIAYASVYGNTENAAELLAGRLRDGGVKTAMYDVSVTPASEIVAEAFRWSHLVFASTTYNAGVFVTMEALVNDLAAHNISNRTVAVIENGSWAPTSGGLIRGAFEKCKGIRFVGEPLTLKSSLKAAQLPELHALADALIATFPQPAPAARDEAPTAPAARSDTPTAPAARSDTPTAPAARSDTPTAPAARSDTPTAPAARSDTPRGMVDASVMFKLSYGLFVLTARDGERDNGCVVNTVGQVTASPLKISVTVNKANYTHDIIAKTGAFNVSVLSEGAPFDIFKRFGFESGRSADKFAGYPRTGRAANGVPYVTERTNAVIAAQVTESVDCGTHTLFIAEVTEAFTLSDEKSVTYQYYFDHIKPKPLPPKDDKKGFVCKICGYVYEGDELPADFVCPLCKHGAADFERMT
uniref:Flavoprotein n=1 Tax=uncultured bacterium contig00034 TaxID=1181523 RepID=A0A806JYN6_9BACT|nr:flavoprotein [uncultured bacterium contig00034]